MNNLSIKCSGSSSSSFEASSRYQNGHESRSFSKDMDYRPKDAYKGRENMNRGVGSGRIGIGRSEHNFDRGDGFTGNRYDSNGREEGSQGERDRFRGNASNRMSSRLFHHESFQHPHHWHT